ncbi:MAG: cell surface protein SprA [Flavobacteriaceae bacterium]|nr:cell surface protein SprA [Flavobacteriaceae bacterium]
MIENKVFSLPNPTKYEAFYDVKSGMYILYPKIGNLVVGSPFSMTPEQYSQYLQNQKVKEYFREKANGDVAMERTQNEQKRKGILPSITIKNKIFETIFGGNKIELIPQGYASFDLGILAQKIDNPLILPQNRKSFAIDIQQRLNVGIIGKVGENLQLRANYDTQSGFAFENRMNLIWQPGRTSWKDLQGKAVNKLTQKIDEIFDPEDRIIKKVEFGNINMPLSTSLIRGSESLFGLKTEFQLGKTIGTLVVSQQQGEARSVVAQNGGVAQTFKLNAVDYEDNQHFFIGQYFHSNYDNALLQYPLINSKININRIEVWVIDQGTSNLQSQKTIVAIRDLGESRNKTYPDNEQNNLYQSISGLAGIRDINGAYNTLKGQSLYDITAGGNQPYQEGENFVFNRRVRRLNDNEFKFNPQLGYISLNQRLNDNQLLAVSYSYTINGDNSKVYKVGEFSEDNASVLITKLLKPNVSLKTSSPMWDLMMKNIYSLNTNQVSSSDFLMNVYYRDPNNGKVNYLPNTSVQDINLLRLLNWDRLNANGDLQDNTGGTLGDGLFDFVPNITIDAENGKLIFTKTQPFGAHLQNVLGANNQQYVFSDLYKQQKQVATQSNLAQRYTIEGRYKSAGSQGISLGAINVPQGSVSVTSNGVVLTEGIDYTVDYLLGMVNIINETIKKSGQPINISLENQMTFNTQRRRFVGLNLERKFNENLLLGATAVNYLEVPLTQKVQFGQEAVNNTMLGLNVAYNNDAPFLTRWTNKIPFVKTEAPSNISFRAEAAYLIPGESKNAQNQSYIDDFEQTSSKISLKDPAMWGLASKPEQNTNDAIFRTASLNDNVASGYGRGLISWYNIDPRFYGVGGKAPNGISAQSVSNHMSRRVSMRELYNTRDYIAGEETFTNTFDISYYPSERGPYNLNPNAESTQERWAGLMRPISVSNFTNSNIEYVEFWMMDPYADGGNLGANPKLLLHLGNVSEDVLKDGYLQYENGLPTETNPVKTTSTNWGIQPNQVPVLYSFATDGAERTKQDVGYDGLDNTDEATKFGTNFINPITRELDPAADDFVYYLSDKFQGGQSASVVERYRYFRNPDGNSVAGSLEVATQMPDAEDINKDFNLDQYESYNQYTIKLDKANLVLGRNNIVDVKEVSTTFQDGRSGKNKWFLFRIPVRQFDTDAGERSQDVLNNVRFARMILTGFDETSTLRFGTFDLVRSDWRKYTKPIAVDASTNEGFGLVDTSNVEVGSVNLEENSLGTPPYVLPPGIDREILSGNTGAQRQNEGSLYLKIKDLRNDARGVFKNVALDLRRYEKLEMFVHAQDLKDITSNKLDDKAKFFIRLGSDATDNYYEYEASIKYTSNNAVSPYEIWPTDNMVALELRALTDIKGRRDKSGSAMDRRYTDASFGNDDKKIYVKGRPSLGNITTIVMGVRNTDNVSKDIVLWLNEIRVSGIENKGGYAANANLNFNLGDFALVNATGAVSSIGFGAITEKPSERAQTEISQFHIDTTVNLDKFLPEKIGMRIPVNYSYTQSIEDPKYNPLDNDVELKNSPVKEDLQKVVRTYSQQRSLGVVNMQKQRMNPDKKQRFYDVENLTFTAVYNDDFYRDIYTAKNYRQNLRGYLDYSYNFKPLVIKPFNKLVSDTAKSAKYLTWIKEFNINPVPTRFSFRTELDRNYNELQYRNIDAVISGASGNTDFETMRMGAFYFGWQYNLGFNLTKSFKLDVDSHTRTLNDHFSVRELNQQSIFKDPFRVGRPILYNHRIQMNYKLPFEYFPYLDFINAELGRGIQYNWTARSTVFSAENLGNLAQNNVNTIATASLNIPSLLGKFKYFQKIEKTMRDRNAEIAAMEKANKEVAEKRASGKKAENNKNYQFKNKLTPIQSILYVLTSIKQVNFNYNETSGTSLPGILSVPNFFGLGRNGGGPTYEFLLGSQADIRRLMIERNWLSTSDLMTEPYTQMNTKVLTGNIQIQPMNDLRIDVNFLKNETRSISQSGYNILINGHLPFANDMISFSHTDMILGTTFRDGKDLYSDLVANARQFSQSHTGLLNPDGFVDGYGLANAYILIPAFKATIGGKNLGKENPTKSKFPLPNWQVIYSGLKNIPLINKYFAKFDIMHGYKATYTVAGVQSSSDYYNYEVNKNSPKPVSDRDRNGNFLNPYTFSQVGYVEEFAPLLGADITMRNNMQLRAMYNKNRAFVLGTQNYTLTEDSGSEYILGFGYIIKDLKLKMRIRGKSRTIKSDLNIKFDFSLRDNKTRITNLLEADSQVTGGQKILAVNFSADYNFSQNFQIKLFYNQLMTRYKISTAYPLSTTRAGITANFTFGGGN